MIRQYWIEMYSAAVVVAISDLPIDAIDLCKTMQQQDARVHAANRMNEGLWKEEGQCTLCVLSELWPPGPPGPEFCA